MDTKRLTKVTAGCTVAMLIPTILLGWWAIDWAQGVAKWSEAADEFPTVDELRGPAIPDAENAALVYQQAWEAVELTEEQEDLLRTSEDPEVLAPILDANAEALRLLHQAAQMEKCRFEPVYEEGEGSVAAIPEMPHLGRLRSLKPLLRALAGARVTSGDSRAASSSVEDHVRLTGHLLQQPNGLIAVLTALDHLRAGSGSLELVLAADDPSPSVSADLRDALADLEPAAGLEFALKMDMAYGIEIIEETERRPKERIRQQTGHPARDRGMIWGGFMAVNRATFAREMLGYIERAQLPWRETSDETVELTAKGPGAMFAAILLPAFQAALSRDEMLAIREMMLVALDISAFAAENGRLPQSLDELPQADEPGYAFDPFSGERLRYEPGEDRAFKLWSAGRDLDDDGGVARGDEPDLSRDEIDLVFRTD